MVVVLLVKTSRDEDKGGCETIFSEGYGRSEEHGNAISFNSKCTPET